MIINPYLFAPSIDPDAQAFITAAAITDPTQQSAINTLVTDLKGYNIWTKFKAIYPIVGGVSSSHAVNLKTPGTYNLSFTNAWTHSSTGMTPNGVSAYADTGLNLVTNALNTFDVHYSTYFRDNTSSGIDMGVTDSASAYLKEGWFLASGGAGGIMYGGFYNQDIGEGAITVPITDSRGFWIDSAVASNNIFVRRNNTSVGTYTGSNTTSPANGIIPIGGCRNVTTNGIIAYSTHQWAFCSIGNGLTTTEAANFYTAVQAYQTTLGRAVIENQILNLDAGNSLSYPGTGTTWTDISSSNGYNGTLNGGVAYSTSNGGILIYDGIDDNVTIPLSKSALANPTGKWTIQFWVYISGSQSSVGIFQMADVLSSSNPWLLLQRQNDTTIRWYVNGGYRITQTITTNTWYNLAINFDGTTVKFYTNGVEEATTYGGGLGVASAASTFLANGFSGYLNGRMPQIQAYTTNLSAGQILQNYNNQKTRYI